VVVVSGYLLQSRLQLDLHPVNRLSLYLLSPALIFSLAQSRIEVPKVALGTILRLGLSVPLPAPLNDL
jgi:predicted permease